MGKLILWISACAFPQVFAWFVESSLRWGCSHYAGDGGPPYCTLLRELDALGQRFGYSWYIALAVALLLTQIFVKWALKIGIAIAAIYIGYLGLVHLNHPEQKARARTPAQIQRRSHDFVSP